MRQETHEMRPVREVLRWCLKHTKASLWKLALLGLIQISVSLASVVYALCSRTLINAAIAGQGDALLLQAGWMLLIVLYRIGINYGYTLWANVMEYRWNIALRARLYRHLQRADFAGTARYHSGVLSERLFNDVDSLDTAIIDFIEGLTSILSSLLFSFAVMYMINPYVPVALLILCAVFFLLGRLIKGLLWRNQNELNDANADRRAYYQESLRNLLPLRVSGAQKNAARRAQASESRSFGVWLKWYRTKRRITLCFSLFYQVGYLVAFALCGRGLLAGTLQYGDMTALLQLVTMFQAPFQEISGLVATFYSAVTSASRLMELEDIPAEPEPAPMNAEQLYRDMSAIRVKDLVFRYDRDEVLAHTSLSIAKGSFTALTGPSGAGKTTLFMLLMGVYQATEGSIALVTEGGEIPIDAGMRKLFSYVPQDHLLISGTLRENLLFMCGEKSDEAILQALDQACADDFVASLPNGLDTVLLEGGQGLSEGQKQRVCIARALLSDAPVLLLDEVTSALDEPAEQRLIANLRAMEDHTILLITHRMAAAALCDTVYRMENGVLKEVGK